MWIKFVFIILINSLLVFNSNAEKVNSPEKSPSFQEFIHPKVDTTTIIWMNGTLTFTTAPTSTTQATTLPPNPCRGIIDGRFAFYF